MWILIDGNNWFCRDFFAAGNRAVDMFVRRVADVRRDRAATRVAICWDCRSFRHDEFPGYKADRDEKPVEFILGMQDLRETLATMDVHSFGAMGFEADDLLATLAATALDEGERATICSADRDLHQCLVDGRINQVTRVLRDGAQLRYEVMTAALLKSQFGVHPHQWVDYRSIVGDKSDGIKGCPGLGAKVAGAVLSRFDDLERFFAEPFVAPITTRERALLLAHAKHLPALRTLLTLRRDAPLPSTWLEPIPF